MIVTKSQLEALRASEAIPQPQMQLTPDDMSMQFVHQHLDSQRHTDIARGEFLLGFAQAKLRLALNEARENGFNRVQFNEKAHTHALNP